MKIIKQISHMDRESDLLFAILKDNHRTILRETAYFNKHWKYENVKDYLIHNSNNFSKFDFINKGDIDERTTRD